MAAAAIMQAVPGSVQTHSQKDLSAMSDAQTRIDQLVKSNDIVLFMKGNASFPMCGFSGRAIQILKACGVETKTLKTVNVLEDEEVRQGIKEYSNWPTIPQLYVKGEFVGGSDIMMEMYQSGELQQVITGQG
jgi:monothiol glutaredoxin